MKPRPARPGRERIALGLTVVTLLLAVGCQRAFRHPVEMPDASREPLEALLAGMNPYLLTNLVSDELLLEVDWVEGLEPNPQALEAMLVALRAHTAPAKRVELRVDDEIPRVEWDALDGRFEARAETLSRYLDADPRDWRRREVVWLLYVPGNDDLLGFTTEIGIERDGEVNPVASVFVFPEAIRREAELWISARKVEQAMLIHEAGHLLGLVSNPAHQERDNPGHCSEASCVMAHQHGRAALYNSFKAFFAGKLPDTYGERCREDLERARQIWASRADEDPGYAQTLERQREIDDLHTRACWYQRRERFSDAVRMLQQARLLEENGEALQDDDGEVVRMLRVCPEESRSSD